MKIKSKPKKLNQKTEKIANNNNKKELQKINKIKKDLIKNIDKVDELSIKKKINTEYKSCIKKLYFFSFLKLKKNYDCTPSKYNMYILDYILNNLDCHLVSQFKENMLSDYIEEFLRREYNYSESSQRIPKFPIYYKNYLHFFCKPTYNCFKFNKIIQNYGEKKAELYYKENYQGGVTNNEGDNGMEESSSGDETSNKENEYAFNENGEIFNKLVKEKLDNVTVMTTINSTGNNTINLNLNNEKIEVFSENKAEISNDSTIGDIMDDIKKELKKIENKKNRTIKKKYKYSYRNIMNYSLKSQDNNKFHKNLSIETRNKANSKDISKNLLLNKENNKKSKFKFSNDKISEKIKSQIFKYNIEAYKINKNRNNKISHEKIQKILKNKYSKNTFSSIYNNNNYPYFNFSKDSKTNIRNISSNIKSTENRRPKKINISGFSDKKAKYKSRNYNVNSIYKSSVGGINTTTGKSTNINYQATHNKKSLTHLIKNKDKTFKTMNFMKSAAHQRTSSQLVQNKNPTKHKYSLNSYHNNKGYISNRKTSSLNLLVTESENPTCAKPSIKIKKNMKLKNKSVNNDAKNINDKNKLINKNENNINHKITVTTNNYFNSLNNKNSKVNNINIKKSFCNQNEKPFINTVLNKDNHNSSSMLNNKNQNQLVYNNKECHTFRKNINYDYNCNNKRNNNLMQIALSLLIDNNSPSKKSALTNKMNNNGNFLMKENNIEEDANKNNYFYINSPTHYNINISNQINININGKINGKINNLRGTKTNKNKSRKKININISSNKQKKTIIQIKKQINNKSSGKYQLTNNNNNKIKTKTRNHYEFLKNGNIQNIYSSRNENPSKRQKTKSVSNLEELINHNKKLIELYKNLSKSKEKK